VSSVFVCTAVERTISPFFLTCVESHESVSVRGLDKLLICLILGFHYGELSMLIQLMGANVGSAADVSEILTASIFRVKCV
jgi:hypothetical protein